jgi:polar amino acid transport system substrate-binding protein
MPELPASSGQSELVVGIVSDNGWPFTVMRNGRLTGFDIELLERFGRRIGRRIRYADMQFGSLIAALATRKIDMIGAVMSVTEERKKQVAFSDPYYEQDAYFFALKRNLAAYASTQPTAGAGTRGILASLAASFRSNIIEEKRYLLILNGLGTTLILSVFSTIFGTALGALVCFLRMSPRRTLNLPAKAYIAVLRGTPVLVLLMLVFYVVFASVSISPVLVAVIAFGMNFAAYAAEIFRSGIESIDKGQREAGIAMGFTQPQTFRFIVLPQMVRRILPVYRGEFISLVKMTSIVGYIAVQDLTKASDIIRSRTFDAFFPLVMVAVLYFVVAWALLRVLGLLEKSILPRAGKLEGVAA